MAYPFQCSFRSLWLADENGFLRPFPHPLSGSSVSSKMPGKRNAPNSATGLASENTRKRIPYLGSSILFIQHPLAVPQYRMRLIELFQKTTLVVGQFYS
jgi:hypothetical protein